MALSKDDFIALNRFGERYQQQLHLVFEQLPQSARSIAGLGKFIAYNRSNSQRVLNAYRASDGIKVLLHLPGIEGQQEFAKKVKPHIGDTLHRSLVSLVKQFQQTVNQYARSHAALKRLLETYYSEQQGDDNSVLRKQLFDSATSLIGSHIEQLFCCYALCQSSNNKQFLHEYAMISKRGIARTAKAPPFVQFYTHDHPKDVITPKWVTYGDKLNSMQFEIALAEPFSTHNILDHYESYCQSNAGLVFGDTLPSPFNATFVFSNPDDLANPITSDCRCSSTSISIKTPTKRLVMLVLIEKQLDAVSNVHVGCYQGNQKVDESKLRSSDMWTERLPDLPKLNQIDVNAIDSSMALNPVPKDMLMFFLDYMKLDKDQFTGYLLAIDHPIWSSTYRIYFEHDAE